MRQSCYGHSPQQLSLPQQRVIPDVTNSVSRLEVLCHAGSTCTIIPRGQGLSSGQLITKQQSLDVTRTIIPLGQGLLHGQPIGRQQSLDVTHLRAKKLYASNYHEQVIPYLRHLLLTQSFNTQDPLSNHSFPLLYIFMLISWENFLLCQGKTPSDL